MEQVFVVERQGFFASQWPQGFLAYGTATATLLEQFAAQGSFVDRATAEQNPQWKQLIPYCVLRRPQAVFCVQRKPAQTEARLHRLLSIGIGGHINPGPQRALAAAPFFARALQRELDEELQDLGASPPEPVFQGLLNDDSNEVGRVHVGLVYTLDLPEPVPGTPGPRVREISKMVGGFRSLAELDPLWQDPGRFESWSRMLFQAGIAGTSAVTRALRTRSARPDSRRSPSAGRGTAGGAAEDSVTADGDPTGSDFADGAERKTNG